MKKRRRITKRCFALFLALLLGLNTLTVSAGEIGGGTEAAQESGGGSDAIQGGDAGNTETPAPAPGDVTPGGDGGDAATPAPGDVTPGGDGTNAATPAPALGDVTPEGDGTNATTPAPAPGDVTPGGDGGNATTPTPGTEEPNPDGDVVTDPALPPVEPGTEVPVPAVLEGQEPVDPDEDKEAATYAVTFAVENPEKGIIRVDGEAVDASAYSKDVEEGSDFTFQAEAMEGWEVGSVSANGEEVGKDGDGYAIRGIAGDTVVAVSFTEVPEAEEELPPEVQAFLDAVAKIPEEITAENVEAAGELLNAAMDAWEAAVDAGYKEHAKVLEAYGKLEAAYAVAEQIWKELSGDDGIGFDLEEPPTPPSESGSNAVTISCNNDRRCSVIFSWVPLTEFGSLSEYVSENGGKDNKFPAEEYPWVVKWYPDGEAFVAYYNSNLGSGHYYRDTGNPIIDFYYNKNTKKWVANKEVTVYMTETPRNTGILVVHEYYTDGRLDDSAREFFSQRETDNQPYKTGEKVYLSDINQIPICERNGKTYTFDSANCDELELKSTMSRNEFVLKYVRETITVVYNRREQEERGCGAGDPTPAFTGKRVRGDNWVIGGWELVTGGSGKYTQGINPIVSQEDATKNDERGRYEIVYEPVWSTMSVIYRDGENGAIFEEQRTDSLKHGDNTPKFEGDEPKIEEDGKVVKVFGGWELKTGKKTKYDVEGKPLIEKGINPTVSEIDRGTTENPYDIEIIYEPIWLDAPVPDPTSYKVVREYYANDADTPENTEGAGTWLTDKNVEDTITRAELLEANPGWLENGGKTYEYAGTNKESLTLKEEAYKDQNIITLKFRRYTYNVIYKDGREDAGGKEIFGDQSYPADGSELKENDPTPAFDGGNGKNKPEKAGYEFNGWKLDTGKNKDSEVKDPSGRDISKDDANEKREIIYVAQWEPEETEYTVVHEYYTNGKETPDFVDEEPPATGKRVGEVVKAADLAKKESHGGNKYVYTPGNQEELKLTADKNANVITLRYERYTYSVIYKDGADGTDGPKAFEDQKHPADGPGLEEGDNTPSFNGKDGKNEPEKEGYTFIGWELTTGTTDDNGSVVEPSGRKVSKDDADGNREIIYVAKWEPKATQYRVVHEYYTNGKAEADSVDRKDPVEGKVGDVVKAADIERQESYGGNEYEYTPGAGGSQEITLGANAEGNVITLRYDRVGYQVIHEYYTDGVKAGESRGGFIAGKRGQEVKASDIGKETAYGGETFEYESADVESLVLEADGKDHVIVLRYNRTTGDEPEPDPEDPTPTPDPEDPTPTPTPEDPEPTPTPEDPTPTPTPEDPEPTPTPEDPEPTPTPDNPEPTPTPENPTPTPAPDATPTPNPTPAPAPTSEAEPTEPEAPAAPAVPRTIAVVPEVPAQADEGSPDIVIVDDEVPTVYFRTQDPETEEYSYKTEEDVPVVNELPETVDEDSPDTVILMDEDVPQAYVKVEDPVEDGYAYIPEEDVPLANMAAPQTGDMSRTALWLGALVSSLGGMAALCPGRRRRKANQ